MTDIMLAIDQELRSHGVDSHYSFNTTTVPCDGYVISLTIYDAVLHIHVRFGYCRKHIPEWFDRWDFIKKEEYSIDGSTEEFFEAALDLNHPTSLEKFLVDLINHGTDRPFGRNGSRWSQSNRTRSIGMR